MSTERVSTGRRGSPGRSGRAADRRLRGFRRSSAATLVVLAVLAAGLGAAAVLRGPRLDSASVNTGTAIARPGQRLVLQADQPIDDVTAAQVSVTPATPFEVDAADGRITLTFDAPLRYAADYAVHVDGVVGSTTGLGGALDYAFTTPDVDVYTLLRGGGAAPDADRPDDRILRSGLTATGGSAASETVFSAPRIQQFAVVGDTIAAVLVGDGGQSSLVVATAGGPPSTVPTPAGGRIQNLHASAGAGLFGFTVNGGTDATGATLQNALFSFDPQGASGTARQVAGFGGEPLRVVDWEFVPGRSSLVAQGTDQQLYLLDPLTGADPTPLGRHGELRGFLAGGVQLLVADPAGVSTIDLSDGVVAPLAQEAPVVDPKLYPGTIATLADGTTIRQYDEVDYARPNPVVGSVVLAADGDGTRELFRSTTEGARVRSFCVSPNGQYLAIETIPSDGLGDGYALPGYSGMTTSFVDIVSGATTRSVPGFLPDWCS